MNKPLYDILQRFSFELSRSIENGGFSLILLAVVSMDESPEYWDMIAAVDGEGVNETVKDHVEGLLISSFINFFQSEEEKIHISKFSVLTKNEGLFTDIERILEIQGNPRELFNVELDGSVARNVVVIKSPVDKNEAFIRVRDADELFQSKFLDFIDLAKMYLIYQQTGSLESLGNKKIISDMKSNLTLDERKDNDE